MNKAKKTNKLLLWNLYLNVIGILGLAFFRFTFNESFDFIIVFGLIFMAIFTLYGIMKEPRSRVFLNLSIIFNCYSLISLVAIGLYYSTNWFNSFEKNYFISLLMLAIPILGIISIGTVLSISRSKNK